MHEDIQKPLKLLMVTDTFIRRGDDGSNTALEPVQREVDGFSHLFEAITWIGYDWSRIKKNKFLSKVKSNNVELIVVPATGGRSIIKKIEAAAKGLGLIPLIIKEVKRHDVIHTRGPSIPALIAVTVSFIFQKKIFWNKFAGNWKQENPPLSYAMLKWLLKKATFSKVTINGRWPNQQSHCLSFENPCITEVELSEGKRIVDDKDYSGKLNFCFIGRVEEAKGVGRLLEMFKKTGNHSRIGTVHVIGEGEERSRFEKVADSMQVDTVFHGYLSREELVKVLKDCHFFILLSDSEGFPKVIAESANYGCIPFVSDVSSIGQYVKTGINGWLIDDLSPENLAKNLDDVFNREDLKGYALRVRDMLVKYTYSYYSDRIQSEILNKNIS